MTTLPTVYVTVHAGENVQLSPFDWIGFAVFIIGFGIGAWSDGVLSAHQLILRPPDTLQLCYQRLWKYTRHPNYFGECFVWLGFYLIACSIPNGWATCFSPIAVFIYLRFAAVPLTEASYGQDAEYKLYKKTTNTFMPWRVRKSKAATIHTRQDIINEN